MTDTTHAPLMTLCYTGLGRQRPAPSAAVSGQPEAPLSLSERAAVLDTAVAHALTKGAELESHTATVAVVVSQHGSLNRTAQLLVTCLRFGLGLCVRPAADRASRVMLTVDERGHLTRWALPR